MITRVEMTAFSMPYKIMTGIGHGRQRTRQGKLGKMLEEKLKNKCRKQRR